MASCSQIQVCFQIWWLQYPRRPILQSNLMRCSTLFWFHKTWLGRVNFPENYSNWPVNGFTLNSSTMFFKYFFWCPDEGNSSNCSTIFPDTWCFCPNPLTNNSEQFLVLQVFTHLPANVMVIAFLMYFHLTAKMIRVCHRKPGNCRNIFTGK